MTIDDVKWIAKFILFLLIMTALTIIVGRLNNPTTRAVPLQGGDPCVKLSSDGTVVCARGVDTMGYAAIPVPNTIKRRF